jgi:hypothetical protein
VDEGKLLLFIKDEVACRAPRRGRRLDAERQRQCQRKRKAVSPLPPSLPLKQRRGHAGAIAMPVLEGDDDESSVASSVYAVNTAVFSPNNTYGSTTSNQKYVLYHTAVQ